MKLEQQQQAQHLYFQTDLSKTQIAEAVGVTRRSLHNWIREHNWEYLKRSGAAMPTFIVANCYQAMAQLSESILSRTGEPITTAEVAAMYRLTLIVNKLKVRTAFNERMETFTGFMDGLQEVNPELARTIAPYITQYFAACANVNAPAAVNARVGRPAPPPAADPAEAQMDKEDLDAWAAECASAQPANTTSRPPYTSAPPPPSPQKPKLDLRKQLRGTASSGPGKVLANTIAA